MTSVLSEKARFQQKALSKKCKVSIGLVNKTIANLERAGAVQRAGRGFSVIDPNKILLEWATSRNLQKEAKGFCIRKTTGDIEKTMPACAIFTAFSGWRLLTKRTPADYREVYIYVPEKDRWMVEQWLKDNKPVKGLKNLFIIYTNDAHLLKQSKKNIAPAPQIFVDIYSIASLSSKYFLRDILEKYPELGFEG